MIAQITHIDTNPNYKIQACELYVLLSVLVILPVSSIVSRPNCLRTSDSLFIIIHGLKNELNYMIHRIASRGSNRQTRLEYSLSSGTAYPELMTVPGSSSINIQHDALLDLNW